MWLITAHTSRGLYEVTSIVSDSVIPQTAAPQNPLSMGFSRQEYCSGLLFPSLGDLSDPGMETTSLISPALLGEFFTSATGW